MQINRRIMNDSRLARDLFAYSKPAYQFVSYDSCPQGKKKIIDAPAAAAVCISVCSGGGGIYLFWLLLLLEIICIESTHTHPLTHRHSPTRTHIHQIKASTASLGFTLVSFSSEFFEVMSRTTWGREKRGRGEVSLLGGRTSF